MEAAFRTYGLPLAIRTDYGPPFASSGLAGLSRLSVWWIRLGITPERIDPGCRNRTAVTNDSTSL
jgi:putative transposase